MTQLKQQYEVDDQSYQNCNMYKSVGGPASWWLGGGLGFSLITSSTTLTHTTYLLPTTRANNHIQRSLVILYASPNALQQFCSQTLLVGLKSSPVAAEA